MVSMHSLDKSFQSKSADRNLSYSVLHAIQITSIILNGEIDFLFPSVFTMLIFFFLLCSQYVRMYIIGRGKIGYLTVDQVVLDAKDPTFSMWDVENSKLVISVKGELSSSCMCRVTARKLWDDVTRVYLAWESISNLLDHFQSKRVGYDKQVTQ